VALLVASGPLVKVADLVNRVDLQLFHIMALRIQEVEDLVVILEVVDKNFQMVVMAVQHLEELQYLQEHLEVIVLVRLQELQMEEVEEMEIVDRVMEMREEEVTELLAETDQSK
jgi:hypothetical protein